MSMSVLEYVYCKDADKRDDYESHIFENVWDLFVMHLPQEEDYDSNSIDVWYFATGDEILCRTEELANMIAGMLNDISGEPEADVGYYDPKLDEESGCTDDRTGWYVIQHEYRRNK